MASLTPPPTPSIIKNATVGYVEPGRQTIVDPRAAASFVPAAEESWISEVADVGTSLYSGAETVIGGVLGAVEGIVGELIDGVGDLIDDIGGIFDTGMSGVLDALSESFDGTIGSVTEELTDIPVPAPVQNQINAAIEDGNIPLATSLTMPFTEAGSAVPPDPVEIAKTSKAVGGSYDSLSKTVSGQTVLDGSSNVFPAPYVIKDNQALWAGEDNNGYEFSYINSTEELTAEFSTVTREVSEMIVHWTETFTNKNLTAKDINDYTDGGIPYHMVIRRDGSLQRGCSINAPSLHTNEDKKEGTIGVVFVGGLNVPAGTKDPETYASASSITREQFNTFDKVIRSFYDRFPGGQVLGHNDVDSEHLDPGFDVREYCLSRFNRISLYQDPETDGTLTPSMLNNPGEKVFDGIYYNSQTVTPGKQPDVIDPGKPGFKDGPLAELGNGIGLGPKTTWNGVNIHYATDAVDDIFDTCPPGETRQRSAVSGGQADYFRAGVTGKTRTPSSAGRQIAINQPGQSDLISKSLRSTPRNVVMGYNIPKETNWKPKVLEDQIIIPKGRILCSEFFTTYLPTDSATFKHELEVGNITASYNMWISETPGGPALPKGSVTGSIVFVLSYSQTEWTDCVLETNRRYFYNIEHTRAAQEESTLRRDFQCTAYGENYDTQSDPSPIVIRDPSGLPTWNQAFTIPATANASAGKFVLHPVPGSPRAKYAAWISEIPYGTPCSDSASRTKEAGGKAPEIKWNSYANSIDGPGTEIPDYPPNLDRGRTYYLNVKLLGVAGNAEQPSIELITRISQERGDPTITAGQPDPNLARPPWTGVVPPNVIRDYDVPDEVMGLTREYVTIFDVPPGKIISSKFTTNKSPGNATGLLSIKNVPGALREARRWWISYSPGGEPISENATPGSGTFEPEMKYMIPKLPIGSIQLERDTEYYLNVSHPGGEHSTPVPVRRKVRMIPQEAYSPITGELTAGGRATENANLINNISKTTPAKATVNQPSIDVGNTVADIVQGTSRAAVTVASVSTVVEIPSFKKIGTTKLITSRNPNAGFDLYLEEVTPDSPIFSMWISERPGGKPVAGTVRGANTIIKIRQRRGVPGCICLEPSKTYYINMQHHSDATPVTKYKRTLEII